MFLSPKIHQALSKAVILHQGQFRVDGKTPYIVHPLSVAFMLRDFSDEEDVVVAGLLHDTVEDTNYTFDELKQEFGQRVRDLVAGVTHNDDGLPSQEWRQAKSRGLEALKSSPDEVVLIRCADVIDNMRDTINDYARVGSKIWNVFPRAKEDKIWHWEQFQAVFKDRLDENVVSVYDKVYNQIKELD